MSMSFLYYREYYRVQATLFVTEEGLFKEVPDDITTGVLSVEVVYRLCTASKGGELFIQDFFNPPAMDKTRKKGGKVLIDGKEWYEEPGDGSTELKCLTVMSAWGDKSWEARVKQMHEVAKAEEGLLPKD